MKIGNSPLNQHYLFFSQPLVCQLVGTYLLRQRCTYGAAQKNRCNFADLMYSTSLNCFSIFCVEALRENKQILVSARNTLQLNYIQSNVELIF